MNQSFPDNHLQEQLDELESNKPIKMKPIRKCIHSYGYKNLGPTLVTSSTYTFNSILDQKFNYCPKCGQQLMKGE